MIFVAPPWGGPEAAYAKGGLYSLAQHMRVSSEAGEEVDGCGLLTACIESAQACGSVRLVAAFLPRNTDVRELDELLPAATGASAGAQWTTIDGAGSRKKSKRKSLGLLATLMIAS